MFRVPPTQWRGKRGLVAPWCRFSLCFIDVYTCTPGMQWDMILKVFLNVGQGQKPLKAVVLDPPSSL